MHIISRRFLQAHLSQFVYANGVLSFLFLLFCVRFKRRFRSGMKYLLCIESNLPLYTLQLFALSLCTSKRGGYSFEDDLMFNRFGCIKNYFLKEWKFCLPTSIHPQNWAKTKDWLCHLRFIFISLPNRKKLLRNITPESWSIDFQLCTHKVNFLMVFLRSACLTW